MVSGEIVELQAGHLVLELTPALGGSVSRFAHSGRDLMRPLSTPHGADPHALYSGMFPMLPFANSLRDNRFTFEGREYQVQPNMPETRLNYHGSGWQKAWQVSEQDGSECLLVLDEVEEAPGYLFSGEQRFTLRADRLAVEVAVTNRSPHRMPFGFGLHPWFPRHGDAKVTFNASNVLLEDEDLHAAGLAPIAPDQDFSSGPEPPRSYQNRCYAGWDGVAEIEWRELGLALRIEADPIFEHLMFHIPAHDLDTFCLEPQSNRTSAFDGLDVGTVGPGVHLLDPGATLRGRIDFTIRERQ